MDHGRDGHGEMARSQTPFRDEQGGGTDGGGCALVQPHTEGEFGGCACGPGRWEMVPRTAVGMFHGRMV